MSEEELERLQQFLNQEMARHNEQPHPDFDGLSPVQMTKLNYSPLSEGCVVAWQPNVSADQLEDIPLLKLVTVLMEKLADKELKLTQKGNLPVKLVKELYELRLLPETYIENGIVKLYKEEDWKVTIMVKHLPTQLGWVKKRNNKLSLTTNGKKVLAGPRAEMLQALFEHNFKRFNLGFSDGYEDNGLMQSFTGFVLYLLLKHGREWRPMDFYTDAFLQAYPMVPDTFQDGYFSPMKCFRSAFVIRFWEGLFRNYNLVRVRGERKIGEISEHREIMGTDLFRALFRLNL